MSDEEEFEDQLEQEKRAKVEEEEKEAVQRGLTYTDDDGTVMEWDPVKRAYFPQIDNDFIARYQMSYGSDANQTESNQTSSTGVATTTSTTAPTAESSNQAWHDYYNYYNQQGGTDFSTSTASSGSDAKDTNPENADQENYTTADYYAYYSYYYGEDYAKKWLNARKEEEEEEDDKLEEEKSKEEEKNVKGKNKKGKDKEAGKRKAPEEPPAWFDVDTVKSTHVYVSGLPSDLTDEEFKELMSKYGLIMFDPHTRRPKLKLYRNADGTLKGDGLCCYIKQESVDLALNILDGSNVHGSIISVERAKFEMKGDFDPSKKKKKLSNKAKRKLKEKQEKLFDWRPDLQEAGTRLRFERIVILKNMFDPKEFETDPALINELREDVRSECAKFGDVRKVQVHDRHPEGAISVTFRSPEEGDACVAAMKGRWFAKKQIIAETYDGKTKYEVHETDAEKEERLRGWEAFLEDNSKQKKLPAENSKGSNQGHSGHSAARQEDPSGSSESGAADASSGLTESLTGDRGGDPSSVQSSQDSQGGAAN